MDTNKIFQLFNDEISPETEESHLINETLFYISGFVKIINNISLFSGKIEKIFQSVSNKIDIKDTENAGKFIVHCKAWNYINKININDPIVIEVLKVKSTKQLLDSINISMGYFQELEEYEKCAFLKGIEEKVKDFLI